MRSVEEYKVQQELYMEAYNKGARDANWWAEKWEVPYCTVMGRIYVLAASGRARRFGPFNSGVRGSLQRLWLINSKVEDTLPKRHLPGGMVTNIGYADLMRISVSAARVRIMQMANRGLRSQGSIIVGRRSAAYYSKDDIPIYEKKAGLVARLQEFPSDGFTRIAAMKLWNVSSDVAKKRIGKAREKGIIENVGSLAMRAGSDRRGQNAMVYRFTDKYKPEPTNSRLNGRRSK
jgi:hypothetical protein